MKKIKVVLIFLSVITVIGGTLSFKLKTGNYICLVSKPMSGCSSVLPCSTLRLHSIPDETITDKCYAVVFSPSVDCTQIACPSYGGATIE